jgi:hypothetical protein
MTALLSNKVEFKWT